MLKLVKIGIILTGLYSIAATLAGSLDTVKAEASETIDENPTKLESKLKEVGKSFQEFSQALESRLKEQFKDSTSESQEFLKEKSKEIEEKVGQLSEQLQEDTKGLREKSADVAINVLNELQKALKNISEKLDNRDQKDESSQN